MELNSAVAILTGAGGGIGSAIARRLAAEGMSLVLADRDAVLLEHTVESLPEDTVVELVVGDVSDRGLLRTAMTGAEMVVHAAGHYALGLNKAGRERMTQANVNGTANTLGIAHELGVGRILYVSTALVFGSSDGRPRDENWVRRSAPQSHYEATKVEAHELALALQRAGAPLLIACPTIRAWAV